MTATTTELRIRAGELTDEHVGMDILNGTRWHSLALPPAPGRVVLPHT
jgi:hypothetical protein